MSPSPPSEKTGLSAVPNTASAPPTSPPTSYQPTNQTTLPATEAEVMKDVAILEVTPKDDDGQTLVLTVEGPTPDSVTSTEVRKVVYHERIKHGYETAGLDPLGSFYPVTVDGKTRYRRQYRFRRGP